MKEADYTPIWSYLSSTAEETENAGKRLGLLLPENAVLAFSGDLGAGKTTFIKGFASTYASLNPREVSSPTFTYLHIYNGTKAIYHFDLYRLKESRHFLELGFSEFFDKEGACCIEWSERISPLLPKQTLFIDMVHLTKNQRKISLYSLDLQPLSIKVC